MSRFSRPLHLAYSAILIWLAYCAVQSARNDAIWACALFVVATALGIVAFIREGRLEDALRREVVRAEQDAAARCEANSLGPGRPARDMWEALTTSTVLPPEQAADLIWRHYPAIRGACRRHDRG
ncbi:hypothetical protein [Streptomyces chartreusis]|uniref:Uncharacterized protein n=1 Tax=Streptomyces chartreusis TaxID=1969 RepID=A0A7H8TJ27_STRCX|nr:hypothetical protein [Streptomyces chartreusis]QKZ23415.1 hypothetical protein HUT05_42285 [Streptomyces chartreusis]